MLSVLQTKTGLRGSSASAGGQPMLSKISKKFRPLTYVCLRMVSPAQSAGHPHCALVALADLHARYLNINT
jgi:hypothetical protein